MKEGNQVQCRDFREIADSYLSDELLIETNHDVMRHLESCAVCSRELAARRDLRHQLRKSFQQAPQLLVRSDFTTRLQTELQRVAGRHARSAVAWRIAYGAVAASFVFAAALGFRAALNQWFNVPSHLVSSQNPNLNGSGDKTTNPADRSHALLFESAAGDHRNCAIAHTLEEKPIALEDAGRTYDSVYINLVSAVIAESALPAGTELVEAHSCVFKGQRFAHMILRIHERLVSVLVMKHNESDQNVSQTEPLIVSAQSNGYQVAYFQTEHHAVFIVSGLSDTENMTIARAIAPSVSKHIQRAERLA
jgi:anti-sigma factor RsiW